MGSKQGSLCSGHGSCESRLTHDLMSNNQGSKDSNEDVQYAKRLASIFTNEVINRQEYRLVFLVNYSKNVIQSIFVLVS